MKPDPEDDRIPKRLKRAEVKVIAANQVSDFQIHDDEADRYHLGLVTKVHNPATKSYDKRSVVESFTKQEYAEMQGDKKGNSFLDQYDEVVILHDPTVDAAANDADAGSGQNGPAVPRGTVADAIKQSKDARQNNTGGATPSGAAHASNETHTGNTTNPAVPGAASAMPPKAASPAANQEASKA